MVPNPRISQFGSFKGILKIKLRIKFFENFRNFQMYSKATSLNYSTMLIFTLKRNRKLFEYYKRESQLKKEKKNLEKNIIYFREIYFQIVHHFFKFSFPQC